MTTIFIQFYFFDIAYVRYHFFSNDATWKSLYYLFVKPVFLKFSE